MRVAAVSPAGTAALVAAVSGVAPAVIPAASAHGITAFGFVSTVSSVEPLVVGLQARVLEGDERLRVANLSRRAVVILDRSGEPYLRLEPGATRTWHEPRVHATRADVRWVTRTQPGGPVLVRSWRVPGRTAGRRFAIAGFLGYAPSPEEEAQDGGGIGWLLPVLAVTLAAAALVGGLVLLRRRSA